MKYLSIEEIENPQGEDFIFIAAAQRLQKDLAPFTAEILSEAPYAVIVRDDNNKPILKNAILSGDLITKITRTLNKS